MKISTKNSMYVQKKDLEFLKDIVRLLPLSISKKIFENKDLDTDDYDIYDFFEFTDEEDIEFFRSLDWLIDYTQVKDLENDELRQIATIVAQRYDEVARKLHSINQKDEGYRNTIEECTLLSYQITTLEDIADINSGLLKIKMPNTKVSIPKLIKNFFSKVSK